MTTKNQNISPTSQNWGKKNLMPIRRSARNNQLICLNKYFSRNAEYCSNLEEKVRGKNHYIYQSILYPMQHCILLFLLACIAQSTSFYIKLVLRATSKKWKNILKARCVEERKSGCFVSNISRLLTSRLW